MMSSAQTVDRAMIKCWHPDPLCRPEFSDLRVIFRADPSSFKTVHPTDYPDLHVRTKATVSSLDTVYRRHT